MSTLNELHTEIDTRVARIRETKPDWLCGKGCDSCCKRLADVPQLTESEWAFLREGLSRLTPDHLETIRHEMARLADGAPRPITCPLLDQTTGACPVYLHRPIACRTYGFYMQRGIGLFCHDIEQQAAEGALSEVIWGNHDAIDRQLGEMGETRSLTAWFSAWEQDRLP